MDRSTGCDCRDVGRAAAAHLGVHRNKQQRLHFFTAKLPNIQVLQTKFQAQSAGKCTRRSAGG